MDLLSIEITLIQKEEERKYSKTLYRPPTAPRRVVLKPLRNSKVTYIVKDGKEVKE